MFLKSSDGKTHTNPTTHGLVINTVLRPSRSLSMGIVESRWSSVLRIAYGKLEADGLCVELVSSPHLHWALIFNEGRPQSDRGANGCAGRQRRGTRSKRENVSRQMFPLLKRLQREAAVVVANGAGSPWKNWTSPGRGST